MGVFKFKRFDVDDCGCGMKICSDSVLLAAWFLAPYRSARRILDVGAGSGVLSLLAADICPDAAITAVEIDATAADAARHNFDGSPWSERLECIRADINDLAMPGLPDIIISNPPYFTNGASSSEASRAMARHQSSLTYATLLSLPLAPGGHLGMVTPADACDDIIFEAEMRKRKLNRLCRVSTAYKKEPSRLLWDFSYSDTSFSDETLEMRNAAGSYSATYRALVEPYYQYLPQR